MPTTTINLTGQALTKTDDTNVTLTLGGTPTTALLKATSLTLGWSGTLADGRIASAATWNAKQNALGYTPEDVSNKSTDVNTDQASNTKYPSVKAVYDWATALFATVASLSSYQLLSGKDATGGYTGMTLFKINFKNAANTFTSFFTNANTAARTYTFQDRDGTILDNTDATGISAAIALKLSKNVVPCEFIVACSDLSTALTTGTTKAYFRSPYAFTLTGVRCSLGTAQTSGSIFTVDVNESGTSVLSTKLTIDNTELTSQTAATPPVISDSAIGDDVILAVDIDQIGDGTAKGLIVTLIGTHAV